MEARISNPIRQNSVNASVGNIRLLATRVEAPDDQVHLKNGKVLSGRAEFAKGSPSNPMSYDEVADKFRGCAEFAKWPRAKTEAVIAQVKSLETAPDVGKLSAALSA